MRAADMETEENEGPLTLQKENVVISNEKPKYTYRELITLALADKTCLTLSNIYNWIRYITLLTHPPSDSLDMNFVL